MADQQLIQALLGTVLSSEGGGDNFSEALPLAQPAPEPAVPTFEDIRAMLTDQKAAPLTKKQRIGGSIADAIDAFVSIKERRPRAPSVVNRAAAANQAEADRINARNLRKARVALGQRESEDRRQDKLDAEAREVARQQAEIARKVAEGESATFEEMAQLQAAFPEIEGEFDPTVPGSAGRLRGLALRRQMDMEREDKFATTRNRTAEEEAKEDAKLEAAFLDEIDQMEFNADTEQLFDGVEDPSLIRKSFVRRIRRRVSGETAQRLVAEFERVVGPAVNEAIKEARKKAREAQAPPPSGLDALRGGVGSGATPGLPAIPFQGVGGTVLDLLKALGGGDVAQPPRGADILGPLSRKPDVLGRLSGNE